ncbi:MAG TPA: phosphoadenosine phosphosulfate reductase family protein [Spirochaetia bacterium]|nr:phosphoadenosine phosphosulfate reductase family protein [Spirochaetia bacterium]
MLKETTLFGVENKIDIAIDRLRHFKPSEGYYLAFSGGKDSVVIKELANQAGIKYDAHYNVTTIDPPELIYFIRKYHSDVIWDRAEKPFLKMLISKGFPMRHQRWCCHLYKENGGNGRRVITGVRWKESYNRSKRKIFEHCFSGGYKSKNKTFVNPIIDWSTDDVWEFIRKFNLPYCSLYDEGWKRIGCLFCPMATKQRILEAERYPHYVQSFIKAFDKLYATGRKSMKRWKDGEEMFWWWLNENRKSDDPDQLMLFE